MGYLDRLADAFARRGSTAEAPAAEAYDLGMVLRASADMFRDEAAARGIALDVSGAEVLTRVPALAVMRIVSNLTVNAIRHSGGSRVELMLEARAESAEVSVENDGARLTAEAFSRYLLHGEKGAMSEGDGLGLAIISELCATHGLELSLDAARSTGTRLTVTLPRA
ncbi:sensor histidine kinase [Mangrovicoccus ximenensis]|uniref:sensor histidine kinase n=1 Tax=Mangrovicoccus ximenensis TaxID=1911570 RepID=UPI000D3B872F|nr:ATP-binding protein [Mangrovicoccus ximenensis]